MNDIYVVCANATLTLPHRLHQWLIELAMGHYGREQMQVEISLTTKSILFIFPLMPARRTITSTENIFYITFTCTNRIPLFTICYAHEVMYKWFNYLKPQKHYIISYVTMPSQVGHHS